MKLKFNIVMEQYLALLDKIIGDSKTLSRTEFEKVYKGRSVDIALMVPDITNDSFPLYRGRLAEDIGKDEDLSNPATFSYVPLALNEKGLPKMGRANYKGQSVFYASERMRTNFKEISKDSNIGDDAYMAKWVLKPNSNLHLYRTIPKWGIDKTNVPNGIFTITNSKIINSELGLYLKRLGYILMSNEEIGKYLGSSYIANCIYAATGVAKDSKGNIFDSDVHYDGIVYPSAIGITDEVNIALKPEFVDKNLELECVIKGKLTPDMKSVTFQQIGINEEGRIKWYEFYIDEGSITGLVPTFFNLSNELIDVSKGEILDETGHCVKSQMSDIKYIYQKYNGAIVEKYSNMYFKINTEQTVRKSSLMQDFSIKFEKTLSGWKYIVEDIEIPLCKVIYKLTLKNKLREVDLNIHR